MREISQKTYESRNNCTLLQVLLWKMDTCGIRKKLDRWYISLTNIVRSWKQQLLKIFGR